MGKQIKIVVGANYGDEGKGLATDFFSKNACGMCLNVLYNGGCQRGHTVQTNATLRHVFHHFGSGTFRGADTYFDEDFMVNPMEFAKEYRSLTEKGYYSECYISSKCRVTTPFDMIINQIVEDSRKENRHGSCGFGIWETQQRYITDEHSYTWGELSRLSPDSIYIYLKYLRLEYLPKRLSYYGIDNIPDEFKKILDEPYLLIHFINDVKFMSSIVKTNDNMYAENQYDTIIFEGGQGLALDENNVDGYPNVTASETGSRIPLLRCGTNDGIEVCYVTRTYFTRHGEGNFPTCCLKSEINPNIVDMTNVYNENQGYIRYGLFDKDEMMSRINKDLKNHTENVKRSLFVTHLNYTGNDIWGNARIQDFKQAFSTIYLSDDMYGNDIRICKHNDLYF